MYFSSLPKIIYSFDGKSRVVLRDISTSVRFRKTILSNIELYEKYAIGDGETPEIIAAKIYGSPEYHWVIMLCNDRFDYKNDFPLSVLQLDEYVNSRYINPDATHHYEKDGVLFVSSNPADYQGATIYPVSNREYEEKINESKRYIRLIPPFLLSAVISEFQQALEL
jgi:hypothetical protein